MNHAVRGLLILCLLAFSVTSRAETFELSIGAGPLGQALVELAKAAEVQMIADIGDAATHPVPGLSGSYVLDAALEQLLKNTGLAFTIQAQTVRVWPSSPERAIGTLQVSASPVAGAGNSSDILATEHLSDYAAPGATVGSLGAARLRDIPRMVSVMSHQRLVDQHVVDVTDALDRMPGLNLEEHTLDRSIAHARAFALQDIQLDGGGLLHSFNDILDGELSIYDRVELLRGSDGLGNGYASPGGLLNLVRKRPLDKPQLVTQASLGSWSFRDLMLDASGPLAMQGRVRGRAVVSSTSKDFFYATSQLQRQSLYGVVEAQASDDMQVRAGAQWSRRRATPWPEEGLLGQDAGQLPFARSQSFTTPWQFDNADARNLFGALDLRLPGDWQFQLHVDDIVTDFAQMNATLTGYLDIESGDGLEFAYPLRDTGVRRQSALRAQLRRGFWWREREHTISLSVDRSRERFDGRVYISGDEFSAPINIYAFDPYAVPVPQVDEHVYDYRYTYERRNVSLALSLRPWDALTVTTAWRWNAIQNHDSLSLDFPDKRDQHNALSYVALNYALDSHWSVFASVADVYNSNMGLRTAGGHVPQPSTGRSLDAGVKYSTPDDATQASLAFYRVELDHPHRFVGVSEDDPRCCYDNNADYRILSQGLDAELIGRVGRRWRVSASYQFNRNWFAGADVFEDGAMANPTVPKHLFKFWLNGKVLPPQWELGLGLHAQSRSNRRPVVRLSPQGVPFMTSAAQAGYARVDARVQWSPSSTWSLALNVENVLDRHYFVAREFDFGANLYGEPRRVRASLRATW